MLKIRVGLVEKFVAPFITVDGFPGFLWFVQIQSGLSLKELAMLALSPWQKCRHINGKSYPERKNILHF